MKRVAILILTAAMAVLLCACGAGAPEAAVATEAPAETAAPAATAEPVPEAAPEATDPPAAATEPPAPDLPETPDGWAESYLAFLDDNYDILAALWPEGITGVGFVDLDLDGMPEMLLFDVGASATMGVQLFDVAEEGRVVCVSSVQEAAAGAFGDEYFSRVSVCASYFEAFRLSRTAEGYCFWIDSANGTLESSWDEIVRFGPGEDGVLTLTSVCERYLESDGETGLVVTERYVADGEETDAAGFDAAFAVYAEAEDAGYDARGVFLWTDIQSYDTTYDGLMAMARDAAEAYVPVALP